MKSSTIIFLLVILFLIYCFQHRNQISNLIESFEGESSGGSSGGSSSSSVVSYNNFLPPFSNSDDIINVPYKIVVGGTMTYIKENQKLLHKSESLPCYTNHFMFTPLHKTKEIIYGKTTESESFLSQRTYVLSVVCKYENGVKGVAEAEIFIFGLNKGRRHFVDQSYQDFISNKKIVSSGNDQTIEVLFKPNSINTEYVAVRFNNNTLGSTIEWKDAQLEIYKPNRPRRPKCNFATPFKAGIDLYKLTDVPDESGTTFVKANALAVNKFCNYEEEKSYGQVEDLEVIYNYSKELNKDKFYNEKLPEKDADGTITLFVCTEGGQTKGNYGDNDCQKQEKKDVAEAAVKQQTHYINKRINSYFPTLNKRINIKNSEHYEQYIQVTIKLCCVNPSQKTTQININHIRKMLDFFNKKFTNEIDNVNNYYKKNLCGYLKTQYYNYEDRINVTDITFSNKFSTDEKYSKLKLGNFRLLGDETKLYNYLVSDDPDLRYVNQAFDFIKINSDNIENKHKIILPLNIYFNSPSSVDPDLDKLYGDINNFIKMNSNAHDVTEKIDVFSVYYTSWNTDDKQYNNSFIDDIDLSTARKITDVISTNICSNYLEDKSTCTSMVTEVTGVGSQIQECSCTRCSNHNEIGYLIQDTSNFDRGKTANDISILPGFGNPYYFCEKQKNSVCKKFSGNQKINISNCNNTLGCVREGVECVPTCNFNFPPDSTLDSLTKHSLNMNSDYYDKNPLHNDNKSNIKNLSQNSCQVYHKDNNTQLENSSLNMNHFRNFLTRFNSNKYPLDLSLCIEHTFKKNNNVEVNEIFKNIYISKYRGKYFAWVKDNTKDTVSPLLYTKVGSSNNYRFINIDQIDDTYSLKNIKSSDKLEYTINPEDNSLFTKKDNGNVTINGEEYIYEGENIINEAKKRSIFNTNFLI